MLLVQVLGLRLDGPEGVLLGQLVRPVQHNVVRRRVKDLLRTLLEYSLGLKKGAIKKGIVSPVSKVYTIWAILSHYGVCILRVRLPLTQWSSP